MGACGQNWERSGGISSGNATFGGFVVLHFVVFEFGRERRGFGRVSLPETTNLWGDMFQGQLRANCGSVLEI